MGSQAVTVIGWLIAATVGYNLLVHGSATTSILTSGFSGSNSILKTLEGR